MNHLKLRRLAVCLFLPALLVAQDVPQDAPASVLARTPPPKGAARMAVQPGAYTLRDGSVVLPDGTRLRPAQDPYAVQAPTPVNPGRLSSVTNQTVLTPEESVALFEQQEKANSDDIASRKSLQEGQAASQETQSQQEALLKAIQGGLGPQGAGNPLSGLPGGGPGAAQRRDDGLNVDPEGDFHRQLRRKTASEVAADNGMVLVSAGTILQLRTENTINTQQGGTCLAFVERDVFSSDATRKYVAIPAGSKVLGAVQLVYSEGQDRAVVIFRQVVLPNGDQIQLFVPEPATDAQGTPGIPGSVDHRWPLKFMAPLVWGYIAGITAPRNAVGLAGLSGGSSPSMGDVVKQNIATQYGQAGQDYLSKVQGLPPEIRVPANASVKMILTGPVYLKPWRQRMPF